MPIRILNRRRSINVSVLENTSPNPARVPMKRNLEHYFETAREVLKTIE